MFTVYTPQGRTFSGSLELLRRVEKLSRTNAGRRPVDRELVEHQLPKQVEGQQALVSNKAVEQYSAMLAKKGRPEPIYHVHQIMSNPVVTLRSDWQLSKALQQFQRFPYQVFPVVNSYRKLLGSLSRQQFYEFIISPDFSDKLLIDSIENCLLKPDIHSYAVDPVTDVRRLTQLLVEKHLDALPVVQDSGEVVGIVSRTDILRCACTDPPLSLWC